ncbi:NUDIX domain-containing protein [Rhizobium sp. XQZ8]|uniref:NUDIX hydrolase n=1 Tax=Rhizobium populisoli TaxID=2859785 RepID=UPI001C67B021|nr:NUDIX domain-containing protein [Rhizobium populisoli]MBW6420815.1 NUDIX domain-containing protein [Rhizobium populisoli]
MTVIRIAAALVLRTDGDTLLVRKHGAVAFMQPGGKIEPGEEPETALLRELQEEIGLQLTPEELRPFGHFEAPAANEPDHIVTADVFIVEIGDIPVAHAAEIAEIRWISPKAPGDIILAELTGRHILPAWLHLKEDD